MKPDLYKALKNYAHESFEETYAGLYTRINSDKNFVNHVERKYRLKQYEQDHPAVEWQIMARQHISLCLKGNPAPCTAPCASPSSPDSPPEALRSEKYQEFLRLPDAESFPSNLKIVQDAWFRTIHARHG